MPQPRKVHHAGEILVDVGINIRTQILDQVPVVAREGNGINSETSCRAVGLHIQSVAQSSGIQGRSAAGSKGGCRRNFGSAMRKVAGLVLEIPLLVPPFSGCG
jgi:hypothetical protein